jgi:exodeoxyribonuclease VII large subunit
MNKNVYSVEQVNRYIRGMFSGDVLLRSIFVRGEVSNCKYHTSGHIFFSIKDASGTLSCIMYQSYAQNLRFKMKDGDKVVVGGSVDVYVRDGRYQLYAREIRPEGAGALYEKFLLLKQELADRGMFDPLYKKPIPAYSKTIGIVTAPTGAAIRDIENIARRRNPYVRLILYPALVQGEGAKDSIARGIRMLDDYGVDVIIVGRGGGSLEDLWAFNEETVAEAVFSSRTPVISAVGHETDTTIADFVADMRAPTPSAAAELAVFDYRKFQSDLALYRRALMQAEERRIRDVENRVRYLNARFSAFNPVSRINSERRHALDLSDAFARVIAEKLMNARRTAESYEVIAPLAKDVLRARTVRLGLFIERFKGLNPLDRLKKGFSYVSDRDQHAVTRTEQASPGDTLTIHVTDGQIITEVKETHKDV